MDLRSRVIAQAKRVAGLRSRLIAHRKQGHRARRLRRAYLNNVVKLRPLRVSLRQSRDPRTRAVRWALRQVGTVEVPAGSNRSPKISKWQRSFGMWLIGQPWCGVFVGVTLRRVGVKVTPRVASVTMIEDDARSGINGFREWRFAEGGHVGDLVVLFGRGVHVEIIVGLIPGGYVTVGGNTSPGTAGSQDNGGGVYRRNRMYADVHGVAVPAYSKVPR